MACSFEGLLDKIDWAKGGGLVPAVVQDATSLRVLMLGYINAEALRATQDTKLVTFFSRSKQRLWQKGETSGNLLRVQDIKLDCDGDALLILAEPSGPVCHTGARTCFGGEEGVSLSGLADLAAVIKSRRENPSEGSYTTKLFSEGLSRMAQKVGEEGVEVALAATTDKEKLADESADLLYHLLVLLEACGQDWRDVLHVLKDRSR